MIVTLGAYEDKRGNVIIYSGEHRNSVKITFTGKNNRLIVDERSQINNSMILLIVTMVFVK